MLGVTFGGKHSYNDMGLLLKSYPVITPPSPKTKHVDILGADGALDLSKVLTGYLQYNRRTITMEFSIMAPREDWPAKHSEIMDALHGEEMQIVLDDDPNYCYTGILSVEGFDPQKVTSGVKITADVEPYKLRKTMTSRIVPCRGTRTETIAGGKMPTVPTIISSTSTVSMSFGGKAYTLQTGENIFPDIVLRNGDNIFTFSGTSDIEIIWREGRF